MSSDAACPICRVTHGLHKMDCQNRYYVDQQLKAHVEEEEQEYDGQPDEAQEWYDFDPGC